MIKSLRFITNSLVKMAKRYLSPSIRSRSSQCLFESCSCFSRYSIAPTVMISSPLSRCRLTPRSSTQHSLSWRERTWFQSWLLIATPSNRFLTSVSKTISTMSSQSSTRIAKLKLDRKITEGLQCSLITRLLTLLCRTTKLEPSTSWSTI